MRRRTCITTTAGALAAGAAALPFPTTAQAATAAAPLAMAAKGNRYARLHLELSGAARR